MAKDVEPQLVNFDTWEGANDPDLAWVRDSIARGKGDLNELKEAMDKFQDKFGFFNDFGDFVLHPHITQKQADAYWKCMSDVNTKIINLNKELKQINQEMLECSKRVRKSRQIMTPIMKEWEEEFGEPLWDDWERELFMFE